jgi:hypothetical protein
VYDDDELEFADFGKRVSWRHGGPWRLTSLFCLYNLDRLSGFNVALSFTGPDGWQGKSERKKVIKIQFSTAWPITQLSG